MNPNQSYPATGEVIDGKYQIERLLGEGGMGAVAKATHLLRRAPVALKFMSPNVVSVPGAVERFLNEGVAASQIESENVVHVFDVGKLPNGSPYLVMEYMEGHDLAEVIAREGHPGIDVPRAVYFIIQALRGLQVAHEAGIIHRDMKPSNCFVVNKEGEPDFVKLLDFGISKVGGKSASLTQTNSALGTPLYMSPEQARSPRDVDLRSDLYSVGVILYELLTGKTPFISESGEFTEILFKLFTQDPPPIRSHRPDLPPELAAVVHKALTREPNERFSTAAEFAFALEPFADARSARVLQRLRAHQPGRASRKSAVSATPVAEPAAAFSNLAVPARTNEMAGAPPRPAADTQKIAQSPATEPLGQIPSRQVVSPTGARLESPAEATAATQFGNAVAASVTLEHHPGVERGKQTDLGASRDAGSSHAVAEKRPSPLVYILAAVLVLIVCGAGIVKLTAKPAPSTPHEATALPAEPPPTAATVAVTAPSAVAEPPASIPDASVASVASVPGPPKKNPEPPPRTTAPPGAGTSRPPRLGDLKIHE